MRITCISKKKIVIILTNFNLIKKTEKRFAWFDQYLKPFKV